MLLKPVTPCDISGVCPYNADTITSCVYWCGEEEPTDPPIEWADLDEIDWGIDFD